MNLFHLSLKQNLNSERGLTLLEVIASMVMISVILVAMAPPLLMSTATRVKMRRVSQAQLIAQEEVNRVQGIMARSRGEPLPTNDNDEYVGLPDTISSETELENAPAPTSISEVQKVVDVDDDGNADFFVQTFREQGAQFSGGETECEPAIFRMGVRVYSMLAQDNLAENNLNTDQISLQMSSGLQGQSTQPMAVLFAEVSRSDMQRSLTAYRNYVDGSGIPDACN